LVETAPNEHVLSDDKVNMYNLSRRLAMFKALRERTEFQSYIPIYRTFYGKPARIFLVRGQGELSVLEVVERSAVDHDNGLDGGVAEMGEATIFVTDGEATALEKVCKYIRSRRGTHQGCVLATLGACLPMHLELHEFCKEDKDVRVVCDADDTYLGGKCSVLYEAFQRLRNRMETVCHLTSNKTKIKALCPSGGTEGIPAWILEAQGGEVLGVKCVGAYVGANTDDAKAWRSKQLEAKLMKRLSTLDEVDAMEPTETEADCKQLRLHALQRSYNKVPNYAKSAMPPEITEGVMAAVDNRLRTSLSLIARADASPPEVQDDWWDEQPLNMMLGGTDVGGHEESAAACYAAMVASCWPKLRQTVPALIDVDLSSTDLPMLISFKKAYEHLCVERDGIDDLYTKYNKDIYEMLQGTKFEGRYRPRKLPKATSLPSLDAMYHPTSDVHPPRQGTLNMVVQHRRWVRVMDRAYANDTTNPHVTTRFREQVRRVAVSQEGAGRWLQMVPDGTYATRLEDRDLEVMLQRRGGLELSAAATAHDALEEDGKQVDRKGDKLANGGEYNRRHNATLRAGADMVRAGAVGAIVLGDKEKPELTNMLNNGHVLDFASSTGILTAEATSYTRSRSPRRSRRSTARAGARRRAGSQPPWAMSTASALPLRSTPSSHVRPQAARLSARSPL
jgi:hypothetical protein